MPGKHVSLLSIFIFGFFLFFASADTFQNAWGYPGMIAYGVVILVSLYISHKFILPWIMPKLTDRHGLILGAASLVILFAIFMILFPIAERRAEVGMGSDSDDALNIAGIEMVAGRYPYYPLTYHGNEIIPFPGAVLLALPFIVVLGTSAYQVFLWLAAYFFMLRYLFKSAVDAFFLCATMIVLSVVFMQNITTGTDGVPNTIFVLFSMWWMVRSITDPEAPLWKKILSSVLAGFAFASRSNFLPLTPLLFSILWQNAGWKEAFKYCAIVGLVVLGLVVPFWLYDPAGFAPIHIQYQKVAQFNEILPYSGLITPLGTSADRRRTLVPADDQGLHYLFQKLCDRSTFPDPLVHPFLFRSRVAVWI